MGRSTLELSESDIQEQCVEWLSRVAAKYPIGFHSVPNEGALYSDSRKSKAQYAKLAKLKRMGLTPGVGDLVLFHQGRLYYAEVKKPGKPQSPKQIEFQKWCARCGVPYRLIHSLHEMRIYVREILRSPC